MLVNPGDWAGDGTSFNVDITDGTNTYTMRIDNDVNLSDQPAPTGAFDVIGIGGQFDNSTPFNSGYQILPRYIPDIIPIVGNELDAFDDLVTTDENMAVNIEVLGNDNLPNPVTSLTVDDNPANGSATVEADNSITYDPTMDFCGEDSFTYIVCDAMLCDTATVNITVNCAVDYPLYPIGEISTVDQNGVADSLGVTCEIRGIVYGVNLRPAGLQFTLIDKDNANDGIGLFSLDEDFGYTVTEGDEVSVQGTISQFNGLTQINPDNVTLLSSGNSLHAAEVVTALGESTESKLIKLENMMFVDPSQWTGAGPGFNVDITDGTNTYSLRIDNDVDLYSMPVPGFALFNVTGLGGQFDSSEPFDDGYQILPRYMEDIEEVVSVVDPSLANEVSFQPNPVVNQLRISSDVQLDQIQITNVLGQTVMVRNQPDTYTEIEMTTMAPGIYFLTFIYQDRIWTAEIVKQ